MINAMRRPDGLTLPVAVEELFWGDAGIGMAIMGSALAAAGIAGNGTPEQVDRVGAAVLRHAGRRSQLGAFCVSEPDAGSDVSSLRTRAVYDEATRRVGAQRHQGVDHQRRHRRRPRGGRRGRPRAEGSRPGELRRAARHEGPVAGSEVQEARHPGVAHRRGRARRRARSPDAACSAARRSSTPSSPAPASAATPARSSRRCRRSRRPARRSARRRSASPAPPTSTPSTTPRSARRSAGRSS